uniref:NUDIX domain-containing protein n=1 Tax=Microbacterium azadirachtae TaxID=582680 RepID=UPI000B026D23|nr:NUDIX domain-containing protein [Microbacterium azadirachtae]
MSVDRSHIRVKAMLIAPSVDGDRHLVSVNAPSRENPLGYHRLIGGSVELGETHREAIIREVDEELGAQPRPPLRCSASKTSWRREPMIALYGESP